MRTSRDRTIIIGRFASSAYGIPMPVRPLRWPAKRPDELLDYSLDLGNWLQDCGDSISSISAQMAPTSAPGSPVAAGYEAQPVELSAYRDTITVWIGGGVYGRVSAVLVGAQTTGGRTFERLVHLPIAWSTGVLPTLSPPPRPDLPSGTLICGSASYWRGPWLWKQAPARPEWVAPIDWSCAAQPPPAYSQGFGKPLSLQLLITAGTRGLNDARGGYIAASPLSKIAIQQPQRYPPTSGFLSLASGQPLQTSSGSYVAIN